MWLRSSAIRRLTGRARDPTGGRATRLLRHPWAFAILVVRAFMANQGLLLAGAVAYYALLSIIPLLILSVVALSHFVPEVELLHTIRRYLEWIVPGQSVAVVDELRGVLAHRDVLGWVLLASMLFFSSLAFSVLESALSVIFRAVVVKRKRHFLISAIIPYGYISILGLGLFLVTSVAGRLQAMGERHVDILWFSWSLHGVSGLLFYLLGLGGEILVLTSIYMVMPVRRPSGSHALFGACAAALLWEVSRHVLVWYFSTLSQIGKVYGSLTTAIAILLSLEVAATFLLFGAQVMAEYQRIGAGPAMPPSHPLVPGALHSATLSRG